MCRRAEQDPGWCIAHHADFLPAATSCEAVLGGRAPTPETTSVFTQRATDRRGRPALAGGLPPKVLA